jgi:uncharacterized protein (TIGR03083 family)
VSGERIAREVELDDVRRAAAACREALGPAADRDWEVLAGDLEWSCRRTLDHVGDALIIYAGQLATRATERVPRARNGDAVSSPAELLRSMETAAAILAAVAQGAPPEARGWHPAGMADGSGFVAMGCTEVLVHTADIAQGLGLAFVPPADLAARVLRRIFPWVEPGADPGATLLWAAGRAPLGDRERLAPDWYWHCAPLNEWDGTIKKRAPAPPATR